MKISFLIVVNFVELSLPSGSALSQIYGKEFPKYTIVIRTNESKHPAENRWSRAEPRRKTSFLAVL